jgi:tRNA U34 2-thiouridine synthase MnmA/TrmU
MSYGFDYIATGHYARISPIIVNEAKRNEESYKTKDPSPLAQDDTTFQLLR